MDAKYADALGRLRRAGWRVEVLPQPLAIPDEVLHRYPWMPAEHRTLVEELRGVVSLDERAWVVTVAEFSSTSDGAYAWNEWEVQSLDAAGSDDEWRRAVRGFWDDHLPVLMSVRSGYAYCAMERSSGRIVRGDEPEYEVTTPVASSFLELLQVIADRGPELHGLI